MSRFRSRFLPIFRFSFFHFLRDCISRHAAKGASGLTLAKAFKLTATSCVAKKSIRAMQKKIQALPEVGLVAGCVENMTDAQVREADEHNSMEDMDRLLMEVIAG